MVDVCQTPSSCEPNGTRILELPLLLVRTTLLATAGMMALNHKANVHDIDSCKGAAGRINTHSCEDMKRKLEEEVLSLATIARAMTALPPRLPLFVVPFWKDSSTATSSGETEASIEVSKN